MISTIFSGKPSFDDTADTGILISRSKNTNVAKTAIARELAGFVLAIATELPLTA